MPRVKRSTKRSDRRKKILDRASGYFLTKSKLYQAAQEAVERGLKFAYVGRRQKKRQFRSLWIVRISAAAKLNGTSYSQLINGLKKVDQLRFLTDARPGATIGQIALQWILSDRAVASTLPNIYDDAQLVEFAGATGVAPLTNEELARVRELYETNFGLEPAVENARAIASA